MIKTGLLLICVPVVLITYAIVIYPALLWIVARLSPAQARPEPNWKWPVITITVPAYNEESSIARTLESLLALRYPRELVQVLVVSDCSTDATDEIVASYRDRGVELVRLPVRSGKTAAENLAFRHARGSIVVNIDASVEVPPDSLVPLVRAFEDETVGVVSGRDLSVEGIGRGESRSEADYVSYEMGVRDLESRVHSIVGASGCFYGTRVELFDGQFPNELSRDFASVLIAREHGFRSVSAPGAVCLVPRSTGLGAEYRRKVRTMARGLATLEYKRHLLNPLDYGAFAWMLLSHKLARWLFYLALPFAPIGAFMVAAGLGGLASVLTLGAVSLLAVPVLLSGDHALPWKRLTSIARYALMTMGAGVAAWWKYLDGERQATWEPTRRANTQSG